MALRIVITPKYDEEGRPYITLLEGTYCTQCSAFLAPPDATDDERIQAAIDHTCREERIMTDQERLQKLIDEAHAQGGGIVYIGDAVLDGPLTLYSDVKLDGGPSGAMIYIKEVL